MAFTKTFAIVASLALALSLIPPLAHIVFTKRDLRRRTLAIANTVVGLAGIGIGHYVSWPIGLAVIVIGATKLVSLFLPQKVSEKIPTVLNLIALGLVVYLLTEHWLPLGPEKGLVRNLIFSAGIIFALLAFNKILSVYYKPALTWTLEHKALFLVLPTLLVISGAVVWKGFDTTFSFIPAAAEWAGLVKPPAPAAKQEPVEMKKPKGGMAGMNMSGMSSAKRVLEGPKDAIRASSVWTKLSQLFPGLGKEFMPPLEEGTFLYMPTLMPHASIGIALDVLRQQNLAIKLIPEVQSVVGKIGRVDSALDPAPISMMETTITVKPQYKSDPKTGHMAVNPQTGLPIRNWRPEIRSMNDIWKAIVKAAHVPGTTAAPKLEPIAGRIMMLQTGMRSAMGLKIRGSNLEDLDKAGLQIEMYLKQVPSIEPSSVYADRLLGAAYLEIDIDRPAIARYGVNIKDVDDVIEIAIGGRKITTTVEGRERYPVRVRYEREFS